MTRTAELAERLDVRLHTHLCETQDEDAFCLEHFGRRPVDYLADVGWMSDRVWLAHVVWPSPDEVARLGAARVGAAHCPSSNMILGSGLAPVAELRAAGAPVGLGRRRLGVGGLRVAVAGGPDGDAAGQAAARRGLDVGARRPRDGHPRRRGLPRPGRRDRRAVGRAPAATSWSGRWTASAFAGALSDPVEAWLRCGPVSARHTVVGGRLVVEDGVPVHRGPRRAARRPPPGVGARCRRSFVHSGAERLRA